MPIDIHLYGKSIQNHESKMNEDSKALYHELVTNKIIPEIKEDHDNELTKEEIDLIGNRLIGSRIKNRRFKPTYQQ